MKFIDLFAGIGGIKIAFENANFKCVFSNDCDKHAKITFDLNLVTPLKNCFLLVIHPSPSGNMMDSMFFLNTNTSFTP